MGLPSKSDEQKSLSDNDMPPIPLISALVRAGVVRAGEMEGMVGRRMLAAAKFLAVNPKANYSEAGRALGITRVTAKERLVILRAKIETGELDLAPYAAGADEDFEDQDVGDIDSGDMALETIRALPSMQGEGVRDFYDQIFDRVPAAVDPGCPHCRAEVAARELEDYEAMGRAGDLGVVTEVEEMESEIKTEVRKVPDGFEERLKFIADGGL